MRRSQAAAVLALRATNRLAAGQGIGVVKSTTMTSPGGAYITDIVSLE